MNLILCYTPFQVLLAEKIIESHPGEDFYGIMIQYGNERNKKYEFYYDKLEKKCIKSKFLLLENGNKIARLRNYLKVKKLFLPNFDKIFFANILSPEAYFFLNYFRNVKIFTFDDGIGSLIDNERYLKFKISYFKKIFYMLLGTDYNPKRVVESSIKHFTIYKNMENFIGRLEYISLFQHSIKQPLEAENVVSIFIGQPIYEDIKSKESNNVSIIQDLIKFYNIEYYFPHPRETYFIKDVLYINTELIFEDYFLNEVSRNPNVHYRLYNFLSGAALNLIGIPNVTHIS
ncbi:CMP-N-acetylneuraminate-beta-galactosamide-alpha -2,3-sialyltransferase [Actinobacillus suis H91-0380]|uniref:CMP-N-acetylneuraminate-beta-galactosamide-alpha-2,3-sialyltransferase n=1 Tax=Actinobacillus suis H91-0380 TaxID=696748 RepID=K0G787_ACTSU|nr:glycosyltransferase family 52 [Actinobacillus suis]AFU20241.1 CMP-N-acetylneuraminate-beta-galactosamide-alpha -2,3-sialyltransferase [Actinobacillus suis H91-0380]